MCLNLNFIYCQQQPSWKKVLGHDQCILPDCNVFFIWKFTVTKHDRYTDRVRYVGAKCYVVFYVIKQYCGSRIFIPNPGSWFSFTPDLGFRIPDPTIQKRGRREKVFCSTCFCSHNFGKIENYFIFEVQKILTNWQRILVFLTQKIVTKLSELWVWDLVYGIQKQSSWRIQGSKKHRIPDPDPQQ